MGDSGTDTESTAEDFNSLEVTDPGPPSGGDDNNQGTTFGVSLGPGQGSVSATGSTAQDQAIGFSDGRGGPGDNFSAFGGITDSAGNPVGKEAQSPSQFSAAMGTIGIDQALNDAIASSPTAGVNQGITPAGISPTFSPDVFDPTVDVDRSGRTAPSAIEQAAMDIPGLDAFGPVAQGFSPVGISPSVTVTDLPSITGRTDTTQKSGLAAIADTIAQNKDKAAAAGIDFGVAAPVDAISIDVPSNVTVGRGQGFSAEPIDAPDIFSMGAYTSPTTTLSNLAAMQDAMNKGTISGVTTGPEMMDNIASKAGITAGVSPAPPGFEEKVGRDFDPSKMAQMEAIMAQPNVMPGMLGIVEDRTKDALATSIALGRNVTPIEGIFGFTAPDMTKDKETIEEFNARTGRSIPQDQIVTDAQGVVIGIKDARGNLVTGRDPNAQDTDMGGETEPKKKAPPKQPTDPCPEGYQLIDGKCTPTEPVVTDTGFVVFPAGRTPPFRRGPFTPATVASNPGIRGLNPITFNIPQNIFKR